MHRVCMHVAYIRHALEVVGVSVALQLVLALPTVHCGGFDGFVIKTMEKGILEC